MTGVNLVNGHDLEDRQMTTKKEKEKAKTGELIIPFGKYKDQKISKLDKGYMEWCIKNFDSKNKWKNICI